MSKLKFNTHKCWWCCEMFEDGEIEKYQSGWLCNRCYSYLKSRGEL